MREAKWNTRGFLVSNPVANEFGHLMMKQRLIDEVVGANGLTGFA